MSEDVVVVFILKKKRERSRSQRARNNKSQGRVKLTSAKVRGAGGKRTRGLPFLGGPV